MNKEKFESFGDFNNPQEPNILILISIGIIVLILIIYLIIKYNLLWT